MSLYKEILLDHYQNPRCHGQLEHPSFVAQEYNPLCGDLVKVSGIVQDGFLQTVRFTGHGCVISQAAASLLCERYHGSPIADILVLDSQAVLDLLQITLGPNRLKCAILVLIALQKGLRRI